LEAEKLKKLLAAANDVLHVLRDQRPRPHLDTKIICAWNGLVLSGLCKMGNCYSANREQYMQTASQTFRGMATGGAASKEEASKVETSKEEPPKQGNRLVASKSPYLLQHAHNPVDW